MSRRLPKLVPLEVKAEKKPETKGWRRLNAPPPDPEMRFSEETVQAAAERVKAILDDPDKTLEVIDRANAAGRVISPGANKFSADSSHPIFPEGMEYLRRYFIAMPNNGTSTAGSTICRGCGEICLTITSRGKHGNCQTMISEVLYRLQNKALCVVCGKNVDEHRSAMYWNRVPLCSQQCLMRWDRSNPDPFRRAVILYTQEKASEAMED